MTESELQIECMQWIRKGYSITGDERYNRWHHSANEREGGKAGFRAKMMGQSKGFPDLVHLGLKVAFEFKTGKGVLMKEQREWLEYLKGLGWKVSIAKNVPEFKRKFCEFTKIENWEKLVGQKLSHGGTVT